MRKIDIYDQDVELGTKECVEVALYMYEQWQEEMKPPLYAYYDFPTWLQRIQNSFLYNAGSIGQCPTCKQTVDIDTHECKED